MAMTPRQAVEQGWTVFAAESNVERGNRSACRPKIVGRDNHRARLGIDVVPRQICAVVGIYTDHKFCHQARLAHR